jgi:hypothetical protein
MGRKSKEVTGSREGRSGRQVRRGGAAKVGEMLPGLVGQIMAQIGSARGDVSPLVELDPAVQNLSQPPTPAGDKGFARRWRLRSPTSVRRAPASRTTWRPRRWSAGRRRASA